MNGLATKVATKENKFVLRHRDDISLDDMSAQFGSSFTTQNVNEGHYVEENENKILNELYHPNQHKRETINQDIINKISARKRNKLRALFLCLKISNEPTNLELDELADIEIACNINDDKRISDYLERINSRRLYHQDKKHLTKRETIIKFLDANYYWGVEQWDYTRKSLFDSVIANFDNHELISRHHHAELLGFNDVILCRDLFNQYKQYVEDNQYKPRQIAKLKEFNAFILQHTIKHKIVSTTENEWWTNNRKLTDNDEQKYYYCWIRNKKN